MQVINVTLDVDPVATYLALNCLTPAQLTPFACSLLPSLYPQRNFSLSFIKLHTLSCQSPHSPIAQGLSEWHVTYVAPVRHLRDAPNNDCQPPAYIGMSGCRATCTLARFQLTPKIFTFTFCQGDSIVSRCIHSRISHRSY